MAVTTTNLGVITAYGDAVAAGYTGTKAEWQALMASYATVAEEANDAKDDAVAAKNTAVAKATEATTAAATANTAKDTATSKATEATTAANTATTKANEASASAQSIAESAAQIQENTDDIDEIESELAVTSPYNITWSQGGINSSGTAVSRTNRIRTDYITIENDSIFVEIPSGFKYAIHAYNASKTRIGYIPSGSDIMTDRKATYKVSDSYNNAVYFRMWVAYADDSDILPTKGADVTVAPFESVIASLKSRVLKSVRILGVGNSYTRDSIRWLCKILKESGYENVVVGHGYLGASTLAEQYASLDPSDSNHSAFEYWKYNDTKNATKTSGKTLDEIFTDEPWDIVIFQQQSDESGQYASYVSSSFDINNFITYISGKVSNADLKFGLMMPWSHADGYTSTKFAEYYNSDPRAMLDAIKTVIPQVADHMSQCDYVVNAGEAIDLGRQNSYLNALGDQMLRTDKNHLYYGIPSYMVGLVYALTLCDVNLNNVMWYPTATDEGQTGITTSGYLAYLAKQCAFTAVNGYALEEDISQLKSDLNEIATEEVSVQLFDKDNFVEGYTLQNTDAVSTPEDLTENSALFVTNVITFDEPLTANTNFALKIDGVSRILSYRLLNGNYVRSGSYSSSNIITGSNYKYITILATENVPIYKIRISAIIASNPDYSALYFCKESDWSEDMSLEYYNYLKLNGYIESDHVIKSANPINYNGKEVNLFYKGIAIGDSLTEGTFNTSNGFEVHKQYAYPMYFYKLTGVTLRNFGVGGATAQSWYERYKNTAFPAYDFAIIALGVNDILQSVDPSTTTTYINNIVNKLKSVNADCKCFIATVNKAYMQSAGWDAMNMAIRSYVSNTSNCYLLDIAQYGLTAPNTSYVNGHLTALGYAELAREYANMISRYVAKNKSDFDEIQFSGTTYTSLPTD